MPTRDDPPKTAIVAVVWLDAHADGATDWTTIEEIDPAPYIVLSVGVMLPTDTKKGHVSIARSTCDGLYDHVLHIPNGMVRHSTVIGCVEDLTQE